MNDDTDDDPERVPLTKVLDELFIAAEEAMEDIKDGIEQADEDHPLDDDSPFERLREQMRTTERQGKEPRVEINIEDELDAIREEEGVEAESVVEDALFDASRDRVAESERDFERGDFDPLEADVPPYATVRGAPLLAVIGDGPRQRVLAAFIGKHYTTLTTQHVITLTGLEPEEVFDQLRALHDAGVIDNVYDGGKLGGGKTWELNADSQIARTLGQLDAQCAEASWENE